MRRLAGVLMIAAVSAAPSQACEDGHWIDEILANGQIIKLEDGSVWKVDRFDALTSSLWLPISDVVVCDDRIINIDDGETVHVRRLR